MKNFLKPVSFVSAIVGTLFAVLLFASAAHADNDELPKVRVVTSEGAFVLLLRPDVAPKTVENFLSYVDKGFYEDTIFHRVIVGFMIQGGGFTEDMSRRPTDDPVVNEATQTLPNLRGTIAMARTQDPDSATSQFFVNVSDNDFLNAGVRGPGYTVFGKVTDGMGVIDRIASMQTRRVRGMADVPSSPIVIEEISRLDSED